MQAASNVVFQPDGHRYFIGDLEVPSCSQIIKRKDPEGFKISPKYLERGRLVHSCLAGEIGVRQLPRDWQGYAQAGLNARDELKLVPIAQEFLIGSEEFEYAGRADEFAAILPGSPLRKQGLISAVKNLMVASARLPRPDPERGFTQRRQDLHRQRQSRLCTP